MLESWIVTLLVGLVTSLLLYWHWSKKYRYWQDRGVKFAESQSVFNNLFLSSYKPIQDAQFERYNRLGRVYGMYDATFDPDKPALTIGDPELLKDIMVKDFSFFPNRRDLGFQDSIFTRMLLLLRDEEWKRVRSIVSPAFSTGKIKRVLGIFKESCRTLIENIKITSQRENSIVEVKRLYGTFAMDVIASVAFSTKIDSYNNPENKFVTEAARVVRSSQGRFSRLFQKMPAVLRKFIFKLAARNLNFFIETTLQIISERKRTGQTRNDFLQLLIDAATETSKDEGEEETGDIALNYENDSFNRNFFKTASSKRMTKNELVAQSLIFFLAGYHSTMTTLSIASYFLALNQIAQKKAYEEVKEVLKETNGVLTYEAIQNIKSIDNIISETLRLYPPFPTIERIASSEYKLGDTGIVVPKGMTIEIPIYSMHRDPNFFPDPETFNPDRFSPTERSQQIPYSYLPFGAGPRNCIAMRLALMEIKVCLAYVISTFQIMPCSKTKVPLEFGKSRNFLQTKDITLQMVLREDCILKD